MARGRRSGRTRADWVYRAGRKWALTDPATQEDVFSGTYYAPINIGVGPSEATAQILYDSSQFVGGRFVQGRDTEGTPLRMAIGAEARPDSSFSGPLIHGVEVGIYMHHEASIWTANANNYLAFRIIVARQDMDTGQAVLPTTYSMWQNTAGLQSEEPAVFANGRQNCWEMRYFKARSTTDTEFDAFIHRPFIKVRRRLEAWECLALYIEVHTNSVGFSGNDFINLWCRTLVTDTNRT